MGGGTDVAARWCLHMSCTTDVLTAHVLHVLHSTHPLRRASTTASLPLVALLALRSLQLYPCCTRMTGCVGWSVIGTMHMHIRCALQSVLHSIADPISMRRVCAGRGLPGQVHRRLVIQVHREQCLLHATFPLVVPACSPAISCTPARHMCYDASRPGATFTACLPAGHGQPRQRVWIPRCQPDGHTLLD